jgi:hypothetical protein
LRRPYAVDQRSDAFTCVTRVCFEDMRRLDVVVTTEAALLQAERWPSVPFADPKRRKLVFSRSAVVDRALAAPLPDPPVRLASDEEFARLSNAFWFRGVMAVTKVVRGDRLVAVHLALDMLRDCCFLTMLLRDRAAGAAFHPAPDRNDRVAAVPGTWDLVYSRGGILDLIERACVGFDKLAAEWTPGYRPRSGPLRSLIDAARRSF